MEVTPEMVEAVRLHEAAERKREELAWQDRRLREQRDREQRLRTGALAQARMVLPDLTEKQLTTLEDIFYEYLQQKHDW